MTNTEILVRKRLLKSGEVYDIPLTREDEIKVLRKFAKRKYKEENPEECTTTTIKKKADGQN